MTAKPETQAPKEAETVDLRVDFQRLDTLLPRALQALQRDLPARTPILHARKRQRHAAERLGAATFSLSARYRAAQDNAIRSRQGIAGAVFRLRLVLLAELLLALLRRYGLIMLGLVTLAGVVWGVWYFRDWLTDFLPLPGQPADPNAPAAPAGDVQS